MAIRSPFLATLRCRSVTLFPLFAITVALGCLLAMLKTGPADTLSENDPRHHQSATINSTPIFSEASHEASRHADDYLRSIDTAMVNGLAVLRGGDGQSIAAQSRYFNALVAAGYAQFGSSYYDPLGSCGVAGSSARQLWHSQIRAINGQANAAGEVGKAHATLMRDRLACLDAARPALNDALAWAPAELASPSLVPAWPVGGAWPESAAERSSTNL